MKTLTKVSGAWKQVRRIFVKQGATYKQVKRMFVKVSGVWKLVYQSAFQPAFTSGVRPGGPQWPGGISGSSGNANPPETNADLGATCTQLYWVAIPFTMDGDKQLVQGWDLVASFNANSPYTGALLVTNLTNGISVRLLRESGLNSWILHDLPENYSDPANPDYYMQNPRAEWIRQSATDRFSFQKVA